MEVVREPAQVRHCQRDIATGLIWASLCAAVLKRFLAHAAQFVGGKPISTRRVAMCAGRIIDEIVTALLACVGIADAFRDGMAFLLANARRSNPRRDRKTGRLRSRLIVVGERSYVITYERSLASISAAS
jgi:hypothetical protein